MASEFEHWHINATVFKDRVEELHYKSDPARNIRRQQCREVWHVEKFLGKGGFGEVRLEKNKEEGKARAVKRIATMSAGITNSECEKELQALLEFSKPKSREAAVFVDFFGWFRDGSDVFLAMEYVELGDLEKNVAHLGKIPEGEARDIAEQILGGLEIMHAQAFAHRDLKPQNVLVVNGPPRWWVKIADFGLSKRLTDASVFHTRSGSLSYMAPEVLNYLPNTSGRTEYTNAVDIWAVGCIIYRIICGVVPFPPGTSLMKYCEDSSAFPLEPLFDSGVKSNGFKFMRRLLVTTPEKRPSATEALQHQWISPEVKTATTAHSTANVPSIDVSSDTTTASLDGGWNTATHAGLKSVKSTGQLDNSHKIPLATAPFSTSNLAQPPASVVMAAKQNANVESVTIKPQGMRVNDSEATLKPLPVVGNVPPTNHTAVNLHEIQAPRDNTPTSSVVRKPVPADPSKEPRTNPLTPRWWPKSRINNAGPASQPREAPTQSNMPQAPTLKDKHITRLKAIYTFDGNEPGDLSFRKGEIIEIYGPPSADEWWWRGSIRKRDGSFPLNYVEHDMVNGKPQPRQASMARVRATKTFIPSSSGHLPLRKGDVCAVVEMMEDGWFRGVHSGRDGVTEGIFPSQCVEDLPMPTPRDFFSGRVTKVKALFDFARVEPADLPFSKGDIVQIVEARGDDWWYGEVHGVRGTFPLNYMEIVSA